MAVICYYKAAGILIIIGHVSEQMSQVASTANFSERMIQVASIVMTADEGDLSGLIRCSDHARLNANGAN